VSIGRNRACSNRRVHELSIAVSLIDAVCDELPRLGEGAQVCRVHLRVGPSSGVVADALRFAFEVAKAGSAIESAELEIDEGSVRDDGRDLELIALEVLDGPADRGSPSEHPQEK
jgi:Zn finger protein HypA/HybF involved in hydrogenase expression